MVLIHEVLEPPCDVGVRYAEAFEHVHRQVTVQVFSVDGVDGVLLALEPVGVEDGGPNLPEDVVVGEYVPSRQNRSRRRAEVGPDEAAELLDGVRRNLHAVRERALWVLGGHLEALALGVVHHP